MTLDRWPADPYRGTTRILAVRHGLVFDNHGGKGRTISAETFTDSNHISFYLLPTLTFEECKHENDRVAGYLKGNPNITTLTVEYNSEVVETKTYLLETLSDTSKAGDKLDSLRIFPPSSIQDCMDPDLLAQFLRSRRNLKLWILWWIQEPLRCSLLQLWLGAISHISVLLLG